jgi:methionine synthase II (cobalamin-independent)
MASRSEKYWLLNYNATTIYKLWDPVRKRVHISRNMIFNEIELAGNISVRDLPQSITAPTNITTTNMLTENKENESIAARIRKIISKTKLSKEAVKIIKVSAKLIDMIAPRRNPNIVYKDLIKENLTLPKAMIIKIIPNEDKPSYEITMISLEIF